MLEFTVIRPFSESYSILVDIIAIYHHNLKFHGRDFFRTYYLTKNARDSSGYPPSSVSDTISTMKAARHLEKADPVKSDYTVAYTFTCDGIDYYVMYFNEIIRDTEIRSEKLNLPESPKTMVARLTHRHLLEIRELRRCGK